MDFVKFVTLILIQASYPILAIVGGGLGCYFILDRWFHFKWRYTEIFHFSIITGCFFLIVPWVFIGIQPDGLLEISIIEDLIVFALPFATYAFGCYAILLILFLYASYCLMKIGIQKSENFEGSNIRKLITFDMILIGLLILEYFVLQLFLPLRGFDAMYYYFPEAEVFYLVDQIPDINYLSFSPVVKGPFNVMLYTFSLYISKPPTFLDSSQILGYPFQMYPLLFLIASSLLAYDLSMELWGERIKARLAMLVFLVTPVVYWTLTMWSYYQDLYVSYFFAAAFYFAWKGIIRGEKHSRSYTVIAIMSMALALISKINAWALFIVLILALPAKRWGKILQLVLLVVLSVFLIARSITNIFIGTGVVIFIFAIFIGYLIAKKPIPKEKISIPSIVAFYIGSMILGGFWVFDRITKSPKFEEELIDLYFNILDSIQWEFSGFSTFSFDLILERMQAVNFWSASLFFFIGTAFCLPWIVPKVIALIRGSEIAPIGIWVLVFFMIWMTYYFQGSVRYLSPIYIPMAVLIVHGFHSLLKFFDVPMESKLSRAVLLFFGCTSFYYLIPIDSALFGEISQELVGEAYNRSAFAYYSHPEMALIQALFFTLFWIGLMVICSGKPTKLRMHLSRIFHERRVSFPVVNTSKIRRSLTSIFLIIVVSVPIAIQSYVWIQSAGDLETFQGVMEYEYNEDFQAITYQIIEYGSLTGAILSVRMPGLQIFTHKPVLDYYYQSRIFGDLLDTEENISFLIEVLKHPIHYLLPIEYNKTISNLSLPIELLSFEFVVVPNIRNIYYEIYMEEIYRKSIFFQSLSNTTYFDLVHLNDRYRLFKIL